MHWLLIILIQYILLCVHIFLAHLWPSVARPCRPGCPYAAREGAHAPNKCLGMRPVAKHPTKGVQQVLRHAPSGQAPNKCQVN
jgi:hypothetical protein